MDNETLTKYKIEKLKEELEIKYKKYFSTGNDSLNILVAGVSGVGKSTLINGVFGVDVAKTGVGKPVTKELKFYPGNMRTIGATEQKSQINFYDTVGLELAEVQRDKVFSDIENLMHANQENIPHLCWYCINAESARVQTEELAFIRKLSQLNIPIIVVLTQAYTAEKADALEQHLRSEALDICDVIQVVALEKQQADTKRGSFTLKAFGLDELVQASIQYFQEFAQAGKYQQLVDEKVEQLTNVLINEQKVSKKSKHDQAMKVVGVTVTAAAGVGISPIPFSDAPLLVMAQEVMMLQIGKIYQKSAQEISTLGLGTLVTSSLGKSLVGNLVKLVPGVGSVAGAVINGSVAAVVTGSLGVAGIGVCESSLFDEIPLANLSETFANLFKKSKNTFKSTKDVEDYVQSFETKDESEDDKE